jgi:hypothetical protein
MAELARVWFPTFSLDHHHLVTILLQRHRSKQQAGDMSLNINLDITMVIILVALSQIFGLAQGPPLAA